jgi:hypothetical protein
VPLALVLAVRGDLDAIPLFVAHFELTEVTVFLQEGVLARLWMFFFLYHQFQTLSMLEIVLKVTLVTDTLPAHLLTVALPFSVHKLSAILPQAFALDRMI